MLLLNHSQIVSGIEKGERVLKAYELTLLADFFHISIKELLGQKEQKKAVVLWRSETSSVDPKDEAKFLQRCYNYQFISKCTGTKQSSFLPCISGYNPCDMA